MELKGRTSKLKAPQFIVNSSIGGSYGQTMPFNAIRDKDPCLIFRGFAVPKGIQQPKDHPRHQVDKPTYGMPRFMRTTFISVRDPLPSGSWMASCVLKEAYYHVSISPHVRKYLAFTVVFNSFQFKVMPFGLILSPRRVTNLTRV